MKIGKVRRVCNCDSRVFAFLEDEIGDILIHGPASKLLTGERVRPARLPAWPVGFTQGKAVCLEDHAIGPGDWPRHRHYVIFGKRKVALTEDKGPFGHHFERASGDLYVHFTRELYRVSVRPGRVEKIADNLPTENGGHPLHEELRVDRNMVAIHNIGLVVLTADRRRFTLSKSLYGDVIFLTDDRLLAADELTASLLLYVPGRGAVRRFRAPGARSYHFERVYEAPVLVWWNKGGYTWCATFKQDRLIHATSLGRDSANGFAAIPEHRLLAIGTFYGHVQLWNVDTGSLRTIRPKDWCTIQTLHWSPRRSTLFIGRKDGVVQSFTLE